MLKDAWWQVTWWVVVLPTSLQAPELLTPELPHQVFIFTPRAAAAITMIQFPLLLGKLLQLLTSNIKQLGVKTYH